MKTRQYRITIVEKEKAINPDKPNDTICPFCKKVNPYADHEGYTEGAPREYHAVCWRQEQEFYRFLEKNKQTTINKAVEILLHGLTTDGAHHKQWYLEQALRMLCEDEYVDSAKDEIRWEEGIAP